VIINLQTLFSPCCVSLFAAADNGLPIRNEGIKPGFSGQRAGGEVAVLGS